MILKGPLNIDWLYDDVTSGVGVVLREIGKRAEKVFVISLFIVI